MEVISNEKSDAAFAKSSMSVPELNNFVVSMRTCTKKAKLQVIQKLLRKVKLYKNKKGSDEQVTANNKKAERLLDEIKILKKVDVDKVSKFSLGNQLTVDRAAAKGSLNERVYTRVACHKLVLDKITKWRQEHNDWESLAAFALSKITGRRYKKKKHTTDFDGTSEDPGNVEVAKLKEFVERVKGKVVEDDDLNNDADQESDPDATSNARLVRNSAQKTENASLTSEPDLTLSKSLPSKPVTVARQAASNPDLERDEHLHLKAVKPKKKLDVIVKQITLDELCDEELFLPPLNDDENSESEETCSNTMLKADDNFFAYGSESSDAENSVHAMEYESGNEQEELDITSTTEKLVVGGAKSNKHQQYNNEPKSYGQRSFGPRKDGVGGKKSNIRNERFSNKNLTKSRGHFPNMRGDSYPKTFSKKDQQGKGYSRKQGENSGKFTPGIQKKRSTYNPVSEQSQKPQSDEHLHPSWQASKRKKEQQKNLFVFQGTKKVFNDDD